jgi:NAD(P)-dependent dehydrogenase (short-subunit alcohol dehydrogenase family)
MSAPILARGGGIGKEMIPVGRIGDEADLSGAILLLASKAGGYINGNVLISDGGRLGKFFRMAFFPLSQT